MKEAMNEIGLKVAKYKAKVKNGEGYGQNGGFTEYPITEQEYAKLKLAIANKEPFTWIHSIEGERLREINAKRDIKEFTPITYSKATYGEKVVCEFGGRHLLRQGAFHCNCKEMFGCNGINFKDKIKEYLGIEIFCNSDINESIRNRLLNKLKNEKSDRQAKSNQNM